MPELPEVQTTVHMLQRILPGLTIHDVWSDYMLPIYDEKLHIKSEIYFELFKKDVTGATITDVSRRAKNVLIHLSNRKIILVHMKMTGHLLYGTYQKNSLAEKGWEKERWIPKEDKKSPLWDPYNRFIHLVFSLSNGKHLVLSDVRKFAKVVVFDSEEIGDSGGLKNIGPEPLEKDFSRGVFKINIFKKSRGKIKQVLMDQTVIAGIGNIYSDEILWQAGVHPKSIVSKIPQEKLVDIFKAIRFCLEKGLDFRGDSTSDYRTPNGERGAFQLHHHAYQRTGEKCSKKNCGGTIQRIKIGGRSGHFCNRHQKLYV